MNIDKAIKLLREIEDPDPDPEMQDLAAAIKLGIQALRRCQELRKYTDPNTYMPLPGETED